MDSERRLHRRTVLRALALVSGATGLSGLVQACGPAAPPPSPPITAPAATPPASNAGAPRVGGTLHLDVSTDPDTLDLHQTSNPASSTVFGYLYPQLVYQDFDKSYKPWIAEKIDIAQDNRTLTFTLRQGPKFENGDPVDANAVKYTFDRLKQIGAKSPLFELAKSFTSVDVVDPRTFRIAFEQPSATIFHDLATAYGGILSQRADEAAGTNYARQPVSYGPYRLENWQTGQELTLVRNPEYAWSEGYYDNRGAPYIERLKSSAGAGYRAPVIRGWRAGPADAHRGGRHAL